MNCKDSKKYVLAYINKELSDEKQAEVTKHLKNCSTCHDLYKKIEETMDTVPEIKSELLNPFLKEKIWESLNNKDNKPIIQKRYKIKKALQLAAAVVIILVSVYSGIQLGYNYYLEQSEQYYSDTSESVIDQYASYTDSNTLIENYLFENN